MNSLKDVFDPLSGPIKPRNRRRNPFWRFRRMLFALALLALVGAAAVVYTFSRTPLPEDRFDDIAQTSFLCTAEVTSNCGPDNFTALLSTAGEDREVIPYEELPQHLIDAVVATEDQDFFEHQGIDPRGIARAVYQTLRRQGVQQGGSTITQQYVKLAFNDADRSVVRKAREAIRAIKLEQDLARECSESGQLGDRTPEQCAKEEILARYLNRAYFGRGASGVQAAARSYFGKDVGDLEVAESAFLAGLLRNPEGADPEEEPDEANRRRTTSLQLMMEAGYITPEEAMAANEAPWNLVPSRDREGLGEIVGAEWGTEYFVEEVQKELRLLYPNGELYTAGLRIYTTLDPRLQRMAYEAAHSPKPGEDLEARGLPLMGPTYLDPNNPDDPAAAIVSLDRDGRVVAMLGGTNFGQDEAAGESKFNLATSSGGNGRQPGSTFKPIGLAVAIEQGISARSLYPAWPREMRLGGICSSEEGPWPVSGGASSQNRYRDLVNALTWSSNIVFAQLVIDIGPTQLRDAAIDLGVTSDLEVEIQNGTTTPCSLILGTQGVPVIDMASVYSTFERGGVQIDPVLIERVENVDGEVICWYPVNGVCAEGPVRGGDEVLSASTARQVTYALTQVVEGGTGRAARFAEDRAVAGKTGTSQKSRDGWFAGYTCGLTTVVWVGHDGDEEIPMYDFRKPLEEGQLEPPRDEDGELIDDREWPNIEGGNMPTWIWAAYMEQATAGMPPCEALETESEFPGIRLNQNLSTTTLPPCGVELDQWGYPRGSSPEEFVYLTTTSTTPTIPPSSDTTDTSNPSDTTGTTTDTTTPTQPPPTDTQPPSSDVNPEGLPRQAENEDGQQPPPQDSTTTTEPCIAPEDWQYQANPGDRPSTTLGDPNATQPPGGQPPGDGGGGGQPPGDGGGDGGDG